VNAPEEPFLGLPVETDLDRVEAAVAIVGVPYGWPYPRQGTAEGCAAAPAAIRRRSARMASSIGHWDFDIDGPMALPSMVDVGDIPGEPDDGPGNARRTTAAIATLLDRGTVPICLGGDDSVPIPILRAYADRGPLTVLQIDAHLDFRDEVQGVREGYSSPMRRASEMSHVERIVQVGLRGVGSARAGDVEDARAAGNLLITARDVHERGPSSVLAAIPADASVFLSLDLDGLDPSVAPGVSAHAAGGLTYPQAASLVGGIGHRLVGMVVTEYVPDLDVNDLTALVACRLVALASVMSTRV
jgi:agmatinase